MANHPKRNHSNQHSARTRKSGPRREGTAIGSAKTTSTRPANSIRIVAGEWRGRKIRVVEADGLRPTGDRVRETLFNWLQAAIPGSRCLDLFAGSGALGLEAASRGAATVTLVESAPAVARQLQQTLHDLGAGDTVQLYNGTAEQFLASPPALFDVVFVDPPFGLQAHQRILEALTADCLAPGALCYVELPTSQGALIESIPQSWTVLKSKRFGDVTVWLLQFDAQSMNVGAGSP